MKLKTLFPHSLAALLLLTLPAAHAQEMNYQGRLTDSNGNPLADGQQIITFSLWDVATGGAAPVWGPFIADGTTGNGHGPMAVLVGGRFNTVLGPLDTAGRSMSTAFSGDRYLEIKVGNNSPITPRQKLLSAPSALNAATIGTADRKINVTSGTNTGTFGQASSFDFANVAVGNGSGLLIETQATGSSSEAAGLFLNGETAIIYSPGDRDILKVYDEDSLAAGPKFRVLDGNGGLETTGGLTAAGGISAASLSLTGNLATTGITSLANTFITGNITLNGGNGASGLAGVVIGAGGSAGQFPLLIRDRNNQDYISFFSDGSNANFSVLKGGAFKPGGGSWTATSDRRVKKNIRDLGNSLEMLSRLHPVSFEYKNPERQGISGMQRGFIAQEVAEVFPEWVNDMVNDRPRKPGEEEEPAIIKTISIKGFEALTVSALKELRAEKDAQIKTLKEDNAVLQARLAALEKSVAILAAAEAPGGPVRKETAGR